ncbi:WD repeat-containing protein 43 [Phlyctochytrium bullatum]|nr:WD repeat-containing protein 43 [Phlyctochytrium bullatum]
MTRDATSKPGSCDQSSDRLRPTPTDSATSQSGLGRSDTSYTSDSGDSEVLLRFPPSLWPSLKSIGDLTPRTAAETPDSGSSLRLQDSPTPPSTRTPTYTEKPGSAHAILLGDIKTPSLSLAAAVAAANAERERERAAAAAAAAAAATAPPGASPGHKLFLAPTSPTATLTSPVTPLSAGRPRTLTGTLFNPLLFDGVPIKEWTPANVATWTILCGFPVDVAREFEEHNVDGEALLALPASLIGELCHGHADQLERALDTLRKQVEEDESKAEDKTPEENIDSKDDVMGKQQKKRAKQPTALSASSVATLRQAANSTALPSRVAGGGFLLSAFDLPKADYLAAVTQVLDTHRISVWDCRTGALVVTFSPPSKDTRITCLAWGRSPATENGGLDDDDAVGKKKKRRRSGGATAAGTAQANQGRIVVAGTAAGEVLFYSLGHGSLQTTLQTNILAPVNDFSFAGAPGTPSSVAYSVSGSGDVLRWDLATGGITGRFKGDDRELSKLAVDAVTGRLAVAGHQIRLYDPEVAFSAKAGAAPAVPAAEVGTVAIGSVTGSYSRVGLLKEFTGHATQIHALHFAKGGATCLSSAIQDRFISVWDSEKGEGVANVAVLAADNPPFIVASSTTDHFLALSETGEVELWGSIVPPNPPTGSAKKSRGGISLAHESVISVVSSTTASAPAGADSKIPVLAAAFSEDKIVIAYGSHVKPTFERVDHQDPNGALLKSIVLSRGELAQGLLVDQDALASKAKATTAQTYREQKRSAVVGSADMMPLQVVPTEEDDTRTLVEPTLEERLNAMNLKPTGGLTQPPTPFKAAVESSGPRRLKRPTAASLQSMLSQAVHTGDKQLLETTLAVTDPRIILATVRRLQPGLVIPLLDMLVSRLQAKPNRAAALIEWIRSIIVAHAAYLMTDRALVRHLAGLYQTLDARANTYQKLVKLSGRLDLIMSQIALRASRTVGDDEAEKDQPEEPEALYNEEDEDDEGDDYADEERADEDLDGEEEGDEDEDGPEFDESEGEENEGVGWDDSEGDEEDVPSDSAQDEDEEYEDDEDAEGLEEMDEDMDDEEE